MDTTYIPAETKSTRYFKPETEEEIDKLFYQMNIGDMVYNPRAELWYTMGLLDKDDKTSQCLFPNIVMDESLPPLRKWGQMRMDYLIENKRPMTQQMGMTELHKHCLEIERQAKQQYDTMMAAIQQDPSNKVTNEDKNADPMVWVGRMNNFRSRVNETIMHDLIYM